MIGVKEAESENKDNKKWADDGIFIPTHQPTNRRIWRAIEQNSVMTCLKLLSPYRIEGNLSRTDIELTIAGTKADIINILRL